jgi:Aldo/keto reductase family
MRLRVLGATGMKVSVLTLGGMMFGPTGNPDEAECARIVDRALEAGVNAVDTADLYSRGISERIVGQVLKGRRVRERVRCEQPPYSLLTRAAETEVRPLCHAYGMGILKGPRDGQVDQRDARLVGELAQSLDGAELGGVGRHREVPPLGEAADPGCVGRRPVPVSAREPSACQRAPYHDRSLSLSDSEHRPAGGAERSCAAWSGGRPRRPVAVFRRRRGRR